MVKKGMRYFIRRKARLQEEWNVGRNPPPTTPPPSSADKKKPPTNPPSMCKIYPDTLKLKIDIVNIDKTKDTLFIEAPEGASPAHIQEAARAGQMYMKGNINTLVLPHGAKIGIIRNEERESKERTISARYAYRNPDIHCKCDHPYKRGCDKYDQENCLENSIDVEHMSKCIDCGKESWWRFCDECGGNMVYESIPSTGQG